MTVSQAWLNAVRVMNATLIRQLARIYAGKPLDGSEYAIHQAARQNRADIVEALLPFEGGKQQSQEHTALMIAAQLGYLDVVSVVLDAERMYTLAQAWTRLCWPVRPESWRYARCCCLLLVHATTT